MIDICALAAANAKRWSNARLTRNFAGQAKALVDSKARYKAVEAKTGVPWWVIAVIHQRESSQNWQRSLAQGDPWNRISTHVPRGRGPFKSWEEAAIDALVNCGPYLARKTDWSLGPALASLELYNGAGYVNRGKPSPYLWAGTNQCSAGKFVADGVYDPAVVDSQLGCAGLLLAMMALDPTITFTGARIGPPIPVAPVPAEKSAPPSITTPSQGSIGAFIAGILAAIFKRK